MPSKKKLRITAPVGEVPSPDRELRDMIKRLPGDATLVDIFQEVGKWEKLTVTKFRGLESTRKSGKLTIRC